MRLSLEPRNIRKGIFLRTAQAASQIILNYRSINYILRNLVSSIHGRQDNRTYRVYRDNRARISSGWCWSGTYNNLCRSPSTDECADATCRWRLPPWLGCSPSLRKCRRMLRRTRNFRRSRRRPRYAHYASRSGYGSRGLSGPSYVAIQPAKPSNATWIIFYRFLEWHW